MGTTVCSQNRHYLCTCSFLFFGHVSAQRSTFTDLVYLVTVKRSASNLFCFVVFQWRRNMPSVSHTVFQRANFGLAFSSPTIFTEIESASTAWIFSQNVPRRMKKVRKDWALHWFMCSDGILLLLPVCVLVWGVCFIRIIFVFVANISWKLWKLLVLIWRFSCVGSICWCEQKKFWIVSFFIIIVFVFVFSITSAETLFAVCFQRSNRQSVRRWQTLWLTWQKSRTP